MFQLDEDISISKRQLQSIAENWERIDSNARTNILAVMNCDKSDEFYKGALSAYCAAARLATDESYPKDAKAVVFQGAAGLIASKLAFGEWPPE